jgi:hypothetical protein
MNIDPKYRFLIGLIVTFAIGVTQGAVQLTNAIPAEWIKPAVAWCGIVAFLGSSITTAISGFGMSNSNRLASVESVPATQRLAHAAAIPGVEEIVTTKAIADATPSDKVVSKA